MPGAPSGRFASRALVLFLLAQVACGSAEPGASRQLQVGRRAAAASTSSVVRYHGGRVLSGAEVVVVFWGSDLPAVVVEGTPGIYRALGELNDLDWISEYDTASQHIRRPSFAGQVVIAPGDTGTTLVDTQIVAELVRQLDAGVLPPATEDSYFPVYFPHGIVIELGQSSARSCVTWAAYHGDLAPASPGTYAVFPDCGRASADAVHELFEAVTDPHADGWYSDPGDEIADLCQSDITSLPLGDGGSLVIQRLWSDIAGGCFGSGNDFALSIDPAEAPAAPLMTFVVSMTPPRKPYAQLSWQVSGLPAGASASSFLQEAQDRWTFTVDLPHADKGFSFMVEGRTESRTAFAGAQVTVAPAPSAPATTGCSQAGGSAGPGGLAAALLIAILCPRRQA